MSEQRDHSAGPREPEHQEPETPYGRLGRAWAETAKGRAATPREPETPQTERLRDLLTNRQMPDTALLTVTLGELREAFAAPGAALDVPDCAKCGRAAADDGIRIFHHADTFACGYATADREAPPRDMYGEHLHAHCQRCHYQWKMPVLGATPDPQAEPET